MLPELVLALWSEPDVLPFRSALCSCPFTGGFNSTGLLFLLLDRDRNEIMDLLFFILGAVGRGSSGGSGESPGMGGIGICAYAIGGGLLGGRKS